MAKGDKKYGSVYEMSLLSGKFIYVCWIREFSFGIFNYISEEPMKDLETLLSLGFKTYKACKETAVRKKIWKLIGQVDLEKEKITWPDLAIFLPYNKELFIEQSRVMRNGNPLIVPQKDYIDLLKRGYIYGFFDNYQVFERWLSSNIEDYPANQDILPLPNNIVEQP
ncbi:Imm26 family immunity protein [Bacteroides heparinolyticus]|uniref:Imm26 family immunity protein n=2 Tax=Prevotella heparinolytica TaxID=28113 RepID=UPI0035A0D927